MTIDQLLKMPIGQKIGGGFTLTVKTTKKSVQLPNGGDHIFTVVLFDNTGDMLADFRSKGYTPLKKGEQVIIIVAEIQAAEKGKKLFVHQYDKPKGVTVDDYFQGFDNIPDWETITKGKIRHGLVCSFIKAGELIDKSQIEELVEYIFTGK